jgi:hypothetical protein
VAWAGRKPVERVPVASGPFVVFSHEPVQGAATASVSEPPAAGQVVASAGTTFTGGAAGCGKTVVAHRSVPFPKCLVAVLARSGVPLSPRPWHWSTL